MDTIFALASGAPPSAVAIIRVSGPLAFSTLKQLTSRSFKPRVATLARLKSRDDRRLIDQGMVIAFPRPNSFTGEDLIELQVHGSRAVVRSLFDNLAACGCRPARPGEFTRRAFLNGKLDLTAVEALGDLIDAETELQRRQAVSGLSGALFSRIELWRGQLLDMLSVIEATIDFVDEGDIPKSIRERISSNLKSLSAEMHDVLAASATGQAIRDGLTVVILGPPNAGKSALMNAIAGRDVAIVSARAGTTRDPIEIRVDLDGLPVAFVDTAGIRETTDEIEREGILRAKARSESADLILWLTEGADMPPSGIATGKLLSIRTKMDLAEAKTEGLDHHISALSGEGISDLLVAIGAALRKNSAGFEPSLVTRSRQKAQIERSLECVERSDNPLLESELVAEELRIAVGELDGLIGAVSSEDVLDQIFKTFCLGK